MTDGRDGLYDGTNLTGRGDGCSEGFQVVVGGDDGETDGSDVDGVLVFGITVGRDGSNDGDEFSGLRDSCSGGATGCCDEVDNGETLRSDDGQNDSDAVGSSCVGIKEGKGVGGAGADGIVGCNDGNVE
jgi:hypothetical protein